MKKNEVDRPIIEAINPVILEIFQKTCEIIVMDNLPAAEFSHCVNTINNTISYLKDNRKAKIKPEE